MEEDKQEFGEISLREEVEKVGEVAGLDRAEESRGAGSSGKFLVELRTDGILRGENLLTSGLGSEDWRGQQDLEEKFEQVSLKDQEGGSVLHSQIDLDSNRTDNSDGTGTITGNEGKLEYSTWKSSYEVDSRLGGETQEHASVSPVSEGQSGLEIKHSGSPSSVGSPSSSVGEIGYVSPVVSPQKPKPRPTIPNVSPELLHLVDSAIMGKPEGLEKLKLVVSGKESFGGEDEADCIGLLVVDSLLATMGGVECFEEGEDHNPPSVMLNSRAAIVAGELIPFLPSEYDSDEHMPSRTRMVRGLLAILKACTRNRAMCSMAGLLGVLLGSAQELFLQEADTGKQVHRDGIHLCYCIQHLASHSLSVIDLHRWLQVITKTVTTGWANNLMLALEKAIGGKESRGPACTFEFDGESSGLLGPGEGRWPFTGGYAFATWIYIESFADTLNTATAAAAIAAAAAATSGKSSAMSAAAAASALAGEGTAHMPRLFSFLTADNQGVEAYFHAQFLVVETGSGKGKKASLHFTYAFKPQQWYFIGLEHTCKQSILGKAESELKLYVDGSLYESRPFEFPRISRPLAFCCIGTNPPPTMAGLQRRRRQCPLFAEMGPIYIFKETLGPERMARLASRGGDVLPSFGYGACLPWLATNDHMRILAEESMLLDADIGGSIHLLYHPKLLSGRFCPDASPSGASGTHRRPAEVLGQVHVAVRVRPAEALWALAHGGAVSLLPLAVSSVQKDSLEPVEETSSLSSITTSLSASIFRIISMAIQHPGNNEELCRARGPEILSRILKHLLHTLSSLNLGKQNGVGDEELVAAIVSLCQAPKNNHALKVQLFNTLLLDLKMWSLCNYGIQKKLLSSLADMVFTESSAMREANAVQMLLDSCRRCYWVIREKDSVDTFSLDKAPRPVGEVNALVDELLVVVELLVGGAFPSLAISDVRCLMGFVVDCPQPNLVARVLQLIYRLVVQPNTSRSHTFADSFISCGGIETLLVLLQREAKAGDCTTSEDTGIKSEACESIHKTDAGLVHERPSNEDSPSPETEQPICCEGGSESSSHDRGRSSTSLFMVTNIQRTISVPENPLIKNLGGISFSISAESARNNVYNIDNGDGVVVRIINLIGALVTTGHLKFGANASPDVTSNNFGNGLHDGGGNMYDDKVSLLLFALQKAFQAAPRRLMTGNVYMALLGASINASSTDDGLNLYDCGHRFEHVPLLLVLLRSLPFASRSFQIRAIQDLLFLACSHPENRSQLTSMEEWPEWILEVLISNYERGSNKSSNGASIGEIEDLIHSFLIIMLEHSMRQKDGWKDIEATIHCAEWLSMVGGSSTRDQRIRREESLPIFKRRLLGGLLDFAARELQVQQTQVIAAAAAGVAAEGLSPKDAKMEAESAAQLSVALAENAIVILMLVEDHLRLQSQLFRAPLSAALESPVSSSLTGSRSNSLGRDAGESSEAVSMRGSSLGDSGGVSLDILASMADSNGQISATVMERLTAAAAAEPYESVRCSFVSYGTCASDLVEGWKYRSRLWYGVHLSSKTSVFGGGGSGWESWKSVLEKDASGNWIELPLVKKSVAMLQALLLDDSGLGGGLGLGGGSGTGMGGMTALYQLLDSDQPFLCMLRMVLASIREDDNGEDSMFLGSLGVKEDISEGLHWQPGNMLALDSNVLMSSRKPRSALLWSVLSPVLNMPISESKRQRVLVASSILYSEVWHAVDGDRKPLRKQYLEAIVPPFVAVLRRWRPLLAGVHELTSSDGVNPLVVDDRALAADSLPLEVIELEIKFPNILCKCPVYMHAALAMISPEWAAAFASPPAAMALAMIAAGAGGGEIVTTVRKTQLRRDSSMFERKSTRLHTFSSFQKPLETPSTFQKPLETPNKSLAPPKDKAAAKAAALAAARDLERNAKIGSGRGLCAVAMATSAQRRSISDIDRVKRWNVSEAMGSAWMECLQSVDTKSVSGKDFNALSYKYVAVLVASFALARNMQRLEVDRRAQVGVIDRHRACIGARAWRKLIHCLIEIRSLFGPLGEHLYNGERVFWKLDLMESSSRMRRCLKRNYKGSTHLGAAANYEDHLQLKADEGSIMNPATASILVPEAMTLEESIDDDEQTETDHFEPNSMRQSVDSQQKQSTDRQHEQVPVESMDSKGSHDQDLVQSQSAAALGYAPCESDERIILELPTSMVRPLCISKGIFQITTKRINFIVDDHNDDDTMESIEARKNAYKAIIQARPLHLSNVYLATQVNPKS
ncbi:hypothetical protein Sjap_020759 [Stephania japonica]|uniref:BEACH-type PH domain-containing protein n=1 Tax=Stephania japonica TaxID=461633 RepID=A0AAP0F3Z4_9MAGN